MKKNDKKTAELDVDVKNNLYEVTFQSTFDLFTCSLAIGSYKVMNKKHGANVISSRMKSVMLTGDSMNAVIWFRDWKGKDEDISAFAREVVNATFFRFNSSGMMEDKFNEESFAYSVGELGLNLLDEFEKLLTGKKSNEKETELQGKLIQLKYKSKVDMVTVLLNVGDRKKMNAEILNREMISGQGGATMRADGDDKIFIWLPDWRFRTIDFGLLMHEVVHATMHRIKISGKDKSFYPDDFAALFEELMFGLLGVLRKAASH